MEVRESRDESLRQRRNFSCQTPHLITSIAGIHIQVGRHFPLGKNPIESSAKRNSFLFGRERLADV